jgi:predicted dehydrogenase
VVALCDRNASLAESKAKQWKVPVFYGDVMDMIAGECIVAASVCTPIRIRSEVVLPLMQAKTHVVVEKPFALSSSEAQSMIEASRKYGVKLTVIHNWLFSYAMRKALRLMNHGELGEVLSAEMHILGTSRNPMNSDPNHWVHSLRGGRFAEMLSHPIYTLQAILGKMEPKHVLASKLSKYYWLPIDELWILMEAANGRKGSIHTSINGSRSEATLKVWGTEADLMVDLHGQILIKSPPLETEGLRGIARDKMTFLAGFVGSNLSLASAMATGRYETTHTALIRDFVRCLSENRNPAVTPEEALAVVETHEDLCSRIASIIGKR